MGEVTDFLPVKFKGQLLRRIMIITLEHQIKGNLWAIGEALKRIQAGVAELGRQVEVFAMCRKGMSSCVSQETATE